MNASIVRCAVVSAGLFVCAHAGAATIHWTDWLSNGTANTLSGVIDVGGESIGVTFAGAYSGVQFGDDATNYWATNSTTYTSSAVDNAPATSDIIQLSQGGTFTITFSRPVLDPVFALMSWNGNTVDFGAPITVLSNGTGYWGAGTPVLNAGGTGFYGSGEVHGVVGLSGGYSSVRVSHTAENWHGFTVGIRDLAPAQQVPVPAPLALLGLGGVALALSTRRRRH